MLKSIKKILLTVVISFCVISIFTQCYAWVVKMNDIWWKSEIQNVSMWPVGWDNSLEKINNSVLSIFHTVKVVMGWVILLYLIYLGFQMMMAMWAEDKLWATKKQIYYSLLAFLFINIPGEIYWLFSWKKNDDVTGKVIDYRDVNNSWNGNMFINWENWNTTVKGDQWIIWFVKVALVGIVILIFLMAWVALISSWGNEDKKKKARYRFINWVLGLIFIWVIEVWTYVIYQWDVKEWQNVFAQLSNMALFFAWPIAIFFLVMGWFYYITSAWDEWKTKKWVMIIKNTFLAVIILLASYAFLRDLADFSAG